MPAADPNEELGCPTDRPSGDDNSLFSQEALDIQKKCHKDLFNDNGFKDVDQAGKDAICVEFAREAIKCRDENGCLDKLGDVADKCLKSTQQSAKQSAGKFADVFLDCFRKGASGEQPVNSADPGQPAFAEAVKLFNSCQQSSGNGCEAELLKSANHYMDVQNNGQGPECRDHVRKSAQECTKFVQNKKTIDGSTETAFRDCVNNRYDTSMRDKECSAKN